MENKTQNITLALLEGRTINQLHHGQEFKTTRLGGIVFLIRKKGLAIESRAIKGYEKYVKPPVEYYCTNDSIKSFCDKIDIPVPEKSYRYFERVDDNRYVMK